MARRTGRSSCCSTKVTLERIHCQVPAEPAVDVVPKSVDSLRASQMSFAQPVDVVLKLLDNQLLLTIQTQARVEPFAQQFEAVFLANRRDVDARDPNSRVVTLDSSPALAIGNGLALGRLGFHARPAKIPVGPVQ